MLLRLTCFVRALLCVIAPLAGLRSESALSFDEPAQLAQLVVATTGNAALVQEEWGGLGTPAGGGLRFAPSGTGDDRVVAAWRTQTYDLSTATSLATVAYVHLGSINGEEGSFHLGFVNPEGLVVPPTDKDFLKKKGALTYIGGALKYKRKDGKLETLIGNKATLAAEGSEFSKVETAITPTEMDQWLRITLTLEPAPAAPGIFAARLQVEAVGSDGLSPPVLLRDFTVSDLPNASLASAVAGRVAFNLYTKKLAAAAPRFDEWTTVVSGPPPAAPVALAATDVGATQFRANWQAPAGGPASYEVQVSAAAHHFAPGTLLGAEGEPGQSAGFMVGAPAVSAVVAGLAPATTYLYRVRATNDNGVGPWSDAVIVTTASAAFNAPPTLDAIADLGLIAPSISPRRVGLSGITAGPGEAQSLVVTALSSAPTIIPHPEIHYVSPAATGELRFLASGASTGPVTITVTVSDGAESVSRSFSLVVRAVREALDFTSDTDLSSELLVSSALAVASWQSDAGIGAPAGGGLRIDLGATAGDRVVAGWRAQTIPADDATGLASSLAFRVAGLVKEIETRVGFVTGSPPGAMVDKEFLKKNNGAHRSLAAFAKLKADGDTLEIGLLNRDNDGAAAETKVTLAALSSLFPAGDWLRLTLHLNRASPDAYHSSYVLEHLGPDGLATPEVVAQSEVPVLLANADVARSLDVSPVFLVIAKKEDAGPLYLDEHEALVLRDTPLAPLVLPADQVTATGLRANWSYADFAPYAASYVLEVSTADDDFAQGTLIAADGSSGHADGIRVNDAAIPGSLVLRGLRPGVAYRYRLRALNGAGLGPLSAVADATTLAGGNAAPTLGVIADQLLAPDTSSRFVALSEISTGGETDQTVTIRARSSDLAIIPHPTVAYVSPATVGSLTLAPTGQEGTATITVTVSDGLDTVSRVFIVAVVSAPERVAFETAAELEAFTVAVANANATQMPGVGVGAPPGGGVYYRGGTIGADNSVLFLRAQDYATLGLTHLETSLLINTREINDLTVKNKAEVRLGFAALVPAALPMDLKKYFEQDRASLHVKFTAEHSPSEGKLNQLKIRLGSYDGSAKVESTELVFSDAVGFENWLLVHLVATPLGAGRVRATCRLEDRGPDGLAFEPRLIATQTIEFTLPALLAASRLQAGFALTTEKTVSTHGFWIDEHAVNISDKVPAAPQILPPLQWTASSLVAAWSPGAEGPRPNSYILEISTAADNFAAGTLLAADGLGGQSQGIAVNGGNLAQKIAGLPSASAYVYRVRGVNLAGIGEPSAVQLVATRVAGANLPPTLDAIPDLQLALGTLDYMLTLTGITDGGEDDQWLHISVSSSNPALIPDPDYLYGYPDSHALMLLTPVTGATGTAVITVKVDDDQDNDSSFERTFTVTVSEPEPLLSFASEADVIGLKTFASEAGVEFAPAAGLPSAPGAMRFTRTANAADHVGVTYRRTAYDGRTAAAFEASVFVNLADVLAITSGKDQAEVWLGFVTTDAPATILKNTLQGGAPALGLKLKVQHEPGKADKLRLIETQLYQRTPSGSINSGNLVLLDSAYAGHWLRLSLHIVRSGRYSYQLRHTVDSWGVDGVAFVARIMASPAWSVTDANFALDDSIYAALQFAGEKSRSTSFLADQWSVAVGSVAPDAPQALAASSVSDSGFSLNWLPPALGVAADGYVLELSRAGDLLAPGTLVDLTGESGGTFGVVLEGYGNTFATFARLLPGTAYLVRVRAVAGDRVGPALAPIVVTTDGAPLAGFAAWGAERFTPSQLAELAISGPLADPDADGLSNLLEYAFGGDPLLADASQVGPQVAVVGDRLRISYRRRVDAPDLTYAPEAGGDLANWSSAQAVEVSATVADAHGLQSVVVEDATSLTPVTPRRFMRVRVLRAP